MSRDKSVWFAEEILLDAKLINFQLETGEWDAVEEMLRAEAQLSRDADTGRLRPKKASEYTLRLIAEVLHIMRLDIEQASYNLSTLAVAEQCLRLIRSCAASGTKMQTYISKDLSILDSMVVISTEYQHPNGDFVTDDLLKKYESCMVVLIQTLGNLVVNNPFNQIIIWDKFDSIILNALIGQNEKIASGAAMIVYNILLGQPNVLPDDVALLNSLAYMYGNGNTEFPHLIIEYLIGVENTYIERLYAKLEPDTRILVLNLAYNILMSNETQDINVSVNFVRFMAHEFKTKSDLILKTVEKYVCGIEPLEVVFLLDILATASSMDTYMDCLQADVSLFINCAFLLRSIHSLGKHSENFFSSINKLYNACGKRLESNKVGQIDDVTQVDADKKKEVCLETTSECTESESSEQYFECSEQLELKEATSERDAALKQAGIEYENALAAQPTRKISLEHKIVFGDDSEPPLIMDPLSPITPEILESMIPEAPIEATTDNNNLETELVNKQSPSEISPPLLLEQDVEQNKSKNLLDPNKEVTRSQNLSTDFDLSEQLQKILGISGTVRSDSLEQKSSNTSKPMDAKSEVKLKVPSVKIDSPEGQKTRIGGFEEGGGPKKINTSIESVEQHVAFGFKASLVRVLGNLCWKNQINKRQIRELEVIPVLLDCCNIDARNPLIMQWVIFAVRNLCENCPENQELIASTTLQGPVDTESLREMGLTLHADPKGNTIKVAPLVKN